MQAVKKHLIWIIIGILALGFLLFDFIYVGSKKDKILKENKSIAQETRSFSAFLGTMTKKIPTPKDLEIGSDYLENILDENKRATAVWKRYADYLDQGMSKDEVVYPASDKEKAGKPVTPLVFADFLSNNYLQAMADAENSLAAAMKPAWSKMLAQSLYATNFRMSKETAQKEGADSAPTVAADLAHIYLPSALIPFKLNEDFQSKEKRWKFWRNYLIFKDILTRVVPNAHVTIKRDVIAFERAPEDFDETTGILKTDILRGEGSKFIENLSVVEVSQIETGNAELVDPDAKVEDEGKPGEITPKFASKPAAGGAMGGDDNYHDVYEVKIELTAHIKVVQKFMQLMLASKDIYYVPVSHNFQRLTDAETMGNYTMPKGENPVKAIPDATFAETPANTQSQYLAFEHESPVRASFVYKVFRPRFSGRPNSTEQATGTGKADMFAPRR